MTLRGLLHRAAVADPPPCWVCAPGTSCDGRMCPAHERQVRDTAMAEGPGYRATTAIPKQRRAGQ